MHYCKYILGVCKVENQKLVNFLNQLLSNYFIMYVKLHRYHWFVQGRHFFQLHEKMEELYTRFATDIDEIAERVLMIDGKPLATMSKYLKEATLDEANADDKEEEIIQQLIHDFAQIISEMKQTGIPLAGELNDEPTSDLLITLQGQLEKDVWMLKAYIAYE
nr:DNA starvation/stationary phase protection protein [Oceanobacillus profundus]